MLPEYIEFLSRLDAFYKLLVEQVKTKTINEAEFYMLMGCKCKAMNRERIRNQSLDRIKTKAI